jgi:DNA-binding MarR family transcriptional regulator
MTRKKQGASPTKRSTTGIRIIERTISPSGDAVIGLYMYLASSALAKSMRRGTRFVNIRPTFIGIPALLKAHPALSQTELAELMGVERMTAGVQVAACIRAGLVRRKASESDARKYSLFVTPKGEANLRRLVELIPQHEQVMFGRLSGAERGTLYRLLRKLAS